VSEGIDLLELGAEGLYFDEPCVPVVQELITKAAQHYGEATAEHCLLRAYFLVPEQLSVLVALYRYYFYQHRMEDALIVAERALDVTARRLHLVGGWSSIGHVALAEAVMCSMGLLRFHLLALKGSAVILLRLERLDEARLRLRKIAEIDERDALGVIPLLALIAARQNKAAEEIADEVDH
jgi:tetratricopeptide (TPR) repeat protein